MAEATASSSGRWPESGEVVLFAHGHLLRVLVARWPGMLPTDGRLLALAPATISSFLLLPVPSA